MKLFSTFTVGLVTLLSLCQVNSYEFDQNTVSYYTRFSRGLYFGLQSGLYMKPSKQIEMDCLDEDFAKRLTHLLNAFLKHGFAFFQFMEDGSSLIADIDACHFDKFAFDIYEMCDLKGDCDIQEAFDRITQGITGNQNHFIQIYKLFTDIIIIQRNNDSNSYDKQNNGTPSKNTDKKSQTPYQLLLKLIAEATQVMGVIQDGYPNNDEKVIEEQNRNIGEAIANFLMMVFENNKLIQRI